MGYLSFDASVKIHRSGRYASTKTSRTGYGGINGYIRHIDRGTDRRNGCEVNHTNPDINADLTLENESYYKDEKGNWKRTDQSKDMVGAVNRRITYAKQHGARIADKGKNDTVIARPIVVQLDSETISEHEDTWVWDVMEIVESMFGAENIVGFSVHRDETNVHLHILFVPCLEKTKADGTIKCAISQTKFFRSPKELAGMHRNMRKKLNSKGYEVEQENKPIEQQLAGYYDRDGVWHQQGLTPEQLKQITGRKKLLDEKEKEIMLSKQELDTLAAAMSDVQEKAKATQENLENNMRIFECQQADFENEKASLKTQMQSVLEEKEKVKKMKAETDDMLKKVYSISDICRKIIAQEHTLNADFLDFLDRYGNRTNKRYRRAVEELYKKFDEERQEKKSRREKELEDFLQLRRQRTADDIVKTYNKPERRDRRKFCVIDSI